MQKSARFIAAAVLLASALFLQIRKMTDKHDISIPEAETSANQDIPPETQANVRNDVRKSDILTTETTSSKQTEPSEETEIVEYDASVPYISESKMRDMKRKFEEVSKYSTDLVGWIYIADSDIDYPVVQGTDNQYYLHRTPDGRRNDLGTIFLDCKCSSDFSDSQNILFGHNMQYGMFGDIRSYKEQANFESHRYGWLLTAECLYRIDFYALAVVSAFHKAYNIPTDNGEWLSYIRDNSIHYTEIEYSDNDRFIALSTCASDFENARALFTGKLVPIG